ncbi:MAG TPA: DUF1700 domain-containing protein [Candidatus Anaerostipes excrementavium]|uniref:DUF1700 domain-containing protein n=1 Tax=Candidatus Anaerostipes excrementavium TaxID=2838463 RepID=A0A9D2B9W1_9FIRM|nr:DUF1700 domain-containing protein [uncultured Anaerostipes sp.]HIX68278.1 DUF1700 domain-containing protein [Candidatus Anaerostipes excrementavium]
MTKKEFIRELREALDGIVPSSIVEENAAYYEGYFESQKDLGKTEKEICEELGNPRLIAKSIAEARGGEGYGAYQEMDEEIDRKETDGPKVKARVYDLNSWKVKLGCFLSILVMILIFVIIFHVFAALSPFILAALVIYFIFRLIRKS